MSIEREIDFLHRLANECEGHGQEFGNGRAVGIREAVKPLHTEITRLTRELAEARDGLVEWVHVWDDRAHCRCCNGHPKHKPGCKLKAALDAARPKPPDPDGTYCDVCGTRMVRSGDEWKCLNCGNAIKVDAAKGGA